jgi:hypothetical protein
MGWAHRAWFIPWLIPGLAARGSQAPQQGTQSPRVRRHVLLEEAHWHSCSPVVQLTWLFEH